MILNLTLWFAVHALFARTIPWRTIALPDLASVDPLALLLAIAAALALIRFKAGLFPVMGACAVIGILHGVLL